MKSIQQQLLFEDLLDDIGKVEVDLKKVADDGETDAPDADDRLVERPIDIDHWKYVFEFWGPRVRNGSGYIVEKDHVLWLYEKYSEGFKHFFELTNRIKAHSRLIFAAGIEYNLPDEIDLMIKPRQMFSNEGEFLQVKFGVDINFTGPKQLFRFLSNIYSMTGAWHLEVSAKGFVDPQSTSPKENTLALDRLTPLHQLMTHGPHAEQYLQNDSEGLFQKYVNFCRCFFHEQKGIVPYIRELTGYTQDDRYVSDIIREFLSDRRTQKMKITKDMEHLIESNPIDADFVRTNEYPGYYVSSPTSMRYNEHAATLDIADPYIRGEFADDIAERQIYLKNYSLRVTNRALCIFVAYLGTFYKSSGIVE